MRYFKCCPTLKRPLFLLFAVAIFLGPVLGTESIADRSAAPTAPSTTLHPTPGGNYTRLLKKTDGTYASQYASRAFLPQNGKGPRIILISAIHIGSQPYYEELQKLMDAQDLLLFEGISKHPDDFKKRAEDPQLKSTGLYGRLAKALGLVPQIIAINYNHDHFINADLSPDKLRQILEDEVKKGGKDGEDAKKAIAQFQELTQMLSGEMGGLKGALIKLLINIVELNPSMRDMVLLQIASADASGNTKGISPRLNSLIIHDRNDAAMQVLREQLAKVPAPKSIGIFYGAAHLADMEKTLVESFGYRSDGEDIWLTAFTFDPSQSKLKEKDIKNYTAKANLVEEEPEDADAGKKTEEKAPAQK